MADLGCSSNAAIAYDYLVGKGLRDFQAAAVVGNLQWESRLNPRLEAMDTNSKMSEIAAEVVRTGELSLPRRPPSGSA
jgi:hypothetical protein